MIRPSQQEFERNQTPVVNQELDAITVILQLWRGKKTLLISMLVCITAAVVFLLVAKPKWTSSVTITQPTQGQMSNINQINAVLFSQNNEDRPSAAKMQETIFNRFKENLSSLAETLSNRKPSQHLTIKELDGYSGAFKISYTDHTPELAQQQLNHYISLVNTNTIDFYKNDLLTNILAERASLENSLETQRQVAQSKKDQEIAKLKQSLIVAEAANIKQPKMQQTETISSNSMFLLGSDAIKAMIEHTQSMPLTFDSNYYKTQESLLSLNSTKIQLDKMQAFSYISKANIPEEKDFPQPLLTIFLGAIIGLFGGAIIIIFRQSLRS